MILPKLTIKQILLLLITILLTITTCFLSGYFIAKNRFQASTDVNNEFLSGPLETANAPLEIEENQSTKTITLYADIKGAVINPGVYEFFAGERVGQLIEKAGGLTAEADRNLINLAAFAEDAMNIYVPKIGEEPLPELANDNTISSEQAQANPKTININTASSEQLQTISGIGTVTAQAIIDYRTQNGKFKTIEDLKNVSGIGDKTFEKIKDKISVAP